ncbi:MAG TPA: hypothetical protein VMW81_10430 [Nitrospinota bacterium]|nr:hypothetical protein [Nitrospinota bacterium]
MNHEKHIIILLVILAAVRIFLFNAAFPFFNNVDEQLHFDMVYKYSIGEIPKKEEVDYSPGSIKLIILYETREYLHKPEKFRGGQFPPPIWNYPFVTESRYFSSRAKYWERQQNHEASAFPLPYFLEAQWFKIGKAVGMEGGYLLYWLRFLNIPVFALLIWLSWITAKEFFPDEPLMWMGVPLILAFFPQDLFYAVTNDTFSALFCGLAFFLLIQIYFKERSSLYHAIAGLSVAAAFMSKISNIALPVLFFVIIFLKGKRLLVAKRFREYLSRFIILLLCIGIPVGILFLRNYLVFGGLMQNNEFIKYLGWTPKPFGEMWNHPIFTLKGLSFFLAELTKSFWRGEFDWHGEALAYRWSDILYVFTTFLFLSVSLYSLFSKKREEQYEKRFVLFMSFFALLVSVLFLAFLSIRFDFGKSFYPTRELPYFLSGRLISGVIIPFLILYIYGIRTLFLKINRYCHPLFVVLLIVILISLSEISLTLPVFKSEFNWFHLRLF